MSSVRPGPDGALILPDGQLWAPARPVSFDRLVPRICHVPEYAFSSGFDAIELAESAGLILNPHQQLALILGLGETAAGKWAAFQVVLMIARQNGKGSVLEALALYWLFGTGEMLIGHSAHEYKTAMEAFRRVLALISNTDWMRKRVKKIINTNGEEGIELLNGQRLRFLARSKGAGRGFTFRKLIWDEAYALTDDQVEAQLPTLSAVDNPQLWVTSSPPLDSTSGAPLFALRRAALAQAPGLVFMDYGADGSLDKLDEVDLNDPELWRRTNPSEGQPHGITMAAMERERPPAMSERGFARERIGIWPPDLTQGFSVFTAGQWAALADPGSGQPFGPGSLTGRPVIAVSVGPRTTGQPTAAIGLASFREDRRKHIELIKTYRGTSAVVGDAVRLAQTSQAAGIVIDPGSPAGSLVGELQTAVKDAGLPEDILITMSTRNVAQGFGMIYDAATSARPEDRTVVHLGQPELTIAVGGAVSRTLGDGRAWDPIKSSVDVTGLLATTNALWGLTAAPQPVDEEPLVVWA